MAAFFYGLLAWAMAGLIPRILVGGGLSLVVYAGVVTGVTALLQQAADSFTGLTGAAASFALLTGVGESLSIIGSAILTRVGMVMASNVVGLRRDA